MMPWPGKPQSANPNRDELIWHRQNTWAGWISACHATPGMRESMREYLLDTITPK